MKETFTPDYGNQGRCLSHGTSRFNVVFRIMRDIALTHNERFLLIQLYSLCTVRNPTCTPARKLLYDLTGWAQTRLYRTRKGLIAKKRISVFPAIGKAGVEASLYQIHVGPYRGIRARGVALKTYTIDTCGTTYLQYKADTEPSVHEDDAAYG